MFVINSPEGKKLYDASLTQLESGKHQWSINLQRVDEWDVTNRGWQRVGPEFEKQSQGALYLGWSEGKIAPHAKNVAEHQAELVEEYDSLFFDELEFQRKPVGDGSFRERSMGRPSQGRTARLQAAITPELMVWLEEQRQSRGEKSISDVVFKLLGDLAEK